MLKYLDNITDKLGEIKKGMENNELLWRNSPESPVFVESVINEIRNKNNEIEILKVTLSEKYAEARRLCSEKKTILARLEKRAIGIHADNPTKLNEYGIKY